MAIVDGRKYTPLISCHLIDQVINYTTVGELLRTGYSRVLPHIAICEA